MFCDGRPGRLGMLYEQARPRFAQRLHSGFSLVQRTFEAAQVSQLLRNVADVDSLCLSRAAAEVLGSVEDIRAVVDASGSVGMANIDAKLSRKSKIQPQGREAG